MKYRVTTRAYDGETECGPVKIETIIDDYDSAYFLFSEMDPIMAKLMRIIDLSNSSDCIENVEIVTELVLVAGDGWDDLAPVSEVVKKSLSYQEYRWEMARKGEWNA